jgi:hypothetical protein
MNEAKPALLKLVTIYVIAVASVGAISGFGWAISKMATRGEGIPFPLVPIITLGAALILLGFFVCTAIGIVVYYDAKRREMEPLLWALVAALVPYFIGLIAYLIARKPIATFCPGCGASVPEHSAYCPQCGHSFQRPCPSCGRPSDPSARFCPYCGAQVGAAQASDPPLAQPTADD